jgi:prepilin-type N-terminal cleavage/methylation domain-containing protein
MIKNIFHSPRSRKLKGFSLVELLVSMAIIAVLLGLVGFGIATAQRNSRDSQRRQKVGDIRLALEDYLTRRNRYPSETNPNEISASKTQIILDQSSDRPIIIELSGPSEAAAQGPSSPTSTVYCYQISPTDGGYLLGALLENGEWFDQSSTLSGTGSCDGSPNTVLAVQ